MPPLYKQTWPTHLKNTQSNSLTYTSFFRNYPTWKVELLQSFLSRQYSLSLMTTSKNRSLMLCMLRSIICGNSIVLKFKNNLVNRFRMLKNTILGLYLLYMEMYTNSSRRIFSNDLWSVWQAYAHAEYQNFPKWFPLLPFVFEQSPKWK